MGCGASAAKKYEQDGGKGKPEESKPPDKKVEQTDKKPKVGDPGQQVSKPTPSAPSEQKAEEPKVSDPGQPTPSAPSEQPTTKDEPKPNDDEEEEEDDDENELTEAEFLAQSEMFGKHGSICRKTRVAISADVEERDASWQAPVHPKTAEQEARLSKALEANFLFSCLSGEDLASVIKAFVEHSVPPGTTVIKQGDEVESGQPALYVFEKGKLSVYKNDVEGAVHSYNTPGQYFGELALLYNAPRAATVVADEDCVLWSIDRSTFNFLVKDAARQAGERRMEFLKQVPLLEKLTLDQKASLCDVMQVRVVPKDEYVFEQGDTSPLYFCILEDGKCCAEKDGDEVMQYESKDFFGELALLRNDPRATSIRALETSKVLCIGADVFHRMVGNLEEEMKERQNAYNASR